jgi:hypothetical protein
MRSLLIAGALALAVAPAAARELVTVPTAAGVAITVAPGVAASFQGFIRDLVELHGYTPRQIHCYARGGHVPGSTHYRGEGCDFDQRGWNKTARTMYRVRDLATKWGLRDGCSFRDCGHIDLPRGRQRIPQNLYAGRLPSGRKRLQLRRRPCHDLAAAAVADRQPGAAGGVVVFFRGPQAQWVSVPCVVSPN